MPWLAFLEISKLFILNELGRKERTYGRGGRIRTFDLLVPNQALYQAEPRPDLSSLVCCTPLAQARTIEFVSDTQKLRELPAVHEVLEQLAPSLARFPRALVVSEVRRDRKSTR